MPTTILITGGNRGLGKGLVATYLSTPDTTVIATVRDLSNSESLSALPKASGSSLLIVKLEIASADSIATAIETLKTHNIGALDIVIANAGISGPTNNLAEAPVAELQKYIDVNAYGPFELFKAVLSLLRSSSAENKAKFVLISSAGGSLTAMYNFMPIPAYGASKALANFLFKWLALDNKDVIIWAQNPGNVDTDMARDGLELSKSLGFDLSSVRFAAPEESARAIKNVIDGATEKMSGKFLDHDGSELAW
ncbi:Short-chain dehydrogenase/reductase SDR [Penicillium canescens]|uniref:Short-chain dehydrogenase/reductase SDR n=1 Tax=Penicillium canescens TaxID=5083 RepID=A0AAD6HYI0_PENCN|nr:Short-chain dehydrogenase/reductase SDR [Penicillium canescens]KAJ5985579.1 Short-chain dehydrogenase/reductase SDR [Penicillium canescens]KAJ6022814.1 Short-chain dehydrogenase/reductase SDR [Penicillium canescens]KAJ6025922.1 Short-chain dehydrogenase/reductase SDR [Penicillium canescens]KAJ6042100.1 Short-chain dehydrogenase/reductase SDR [Penicillium canescens]KAJ6076150.1 Short-chain dehydrogenase/reductase SDR [Penicillium canescens]